MTKFNKRFKLFLTILIILSFLSPMPGYSPLAAEDEEGEVSQAEAPELQSSQQSKEPEFVPGQLIVKLKEGKTLDDVRYLNEKHKIVMTEEVFRKSPSPEETLGNFKKELQELETPRHDGWYWQLDKNSPEYKNYVAKLEAEKERLHKQIQAQEELMDRLEARKKDAPKDAKAPDLTNIYLLKTEEKDIDVNAIVQEYASDPNVEYAQPNYYVHLYDLPDDPDISSNGRDFTKGACANPALERAWYLLEIGMDKVWRDFPDIDGRGIIVAVIDTGVDMTHPELNGQLWINKIELNGKAGKVDDPQGEGCVDAIYGANLVERNGDISDFYGHGTAVASIIAAKRNNKIGFAGIAPKVKIMVIRSLSRDIVDSAASGGFAGEAARSARAIIYAVNHGAQIINCSWGVPDPAGLIKDAVQYAIAHGCIVVTAGGNLPRLVRPEQNGGAPVTTPGVFVVGPSDHLDQRCTWGSYSEHMDLVAPGGRNYKPGESGTNIFVALSKDAKDDFGKCQEKRGEQGGYAFQSGTSFSAPIVCGALALMKQKHPDWTWQEIKKALLVTAKDINVSGWDVGTGHGRLDVYAALKASKPDIEAKISNVENITPELIRIMGTATAGDFKEYTLDYTQVKPFVFAAEQKCTDPNQPFIRISNKTTPCVNAELGQLDIGKLAVGEYIIRLTTFTRSGQRLSGTFLVPVKIVDTMPPKVNTAWFEERPSTSNPEVHLILEADDSHPYASGMDPAKGAQMQFSEDKINYSAPVPYATRVPWTLKYPCGEKEIFARFKDVAGNWSEAKRAAITLTDATAPTPPVVRDEGVFTCSTTRLSFQWSSTDPESGINKYGLMLAADPDDGMTYYLNDNVPASQTNITLNNLKLTVGKKYVLCVKAYNGVGMDSEGYSDGITVARPYSISGRIATASGAGVGNIIVEAGGKAKFNEADGSYTMPYLVPGDYTVIPVSNDGRWKLTPGYRSVTITTSDVTNINFTAQQVYSISGRVVNASAVGEAGVTVQVPGYLPVVTDANGYYRLSGLPGSYDYPVTVSKPGCTFSPSRNLVYIRDSDVNNINFVVLSSPTSGYYIAGRITTNAGVGVSGVTVSISGQNTSTDTGGYYMKTGLRNGSYAVIASKAGYVCYPASYTININNANRDGIYFNANPGTPISYFISGWVRDTNGNGVGGVSVSIGGTTVTTEAGGYYHRSGLSSGTYQVVPSKAGYTFNPVSRSATVNNSDVTDISFIASGSGGGGGTPISYTISGYVKNHSGAGVSYIPIVVAGGGVTANASTDSSGRYQIAMPAGVTYTITPSRYSGYTFTPTSQSVYLNDRDISGINFTAQ